MEPLIDPIEECFKSNQGVKARLKKPAFVRKLAKKMIEAQIILINRHLPGMTILERRRAELVKSGKYHGQVVK